MAASRARPKKITSKTPAPAKPRAGSARVALERTRGEIKRAVIKGLRGYNLTKTGRKEYSEIAISLRDADGAIVGGLLAELYWDWMFVRLFWIDEQYRRSGRGAQMLRQAEEEARKRGTTRAYLDTMSFQAPDFYAKCGYREFARLDDFPAGHRRHWFAKTL